MLVEGIHQDVIVILHAIDLAEQYLWYRQPGCQSLGICAVAMGLDEPGTA